jgi:hypothetical protein
VGAIKEKEKERDYYPILWVIVFCFGFIAVG